MAEVVWTEQASDDVVAIGRYIAQFDPSAAARMEARLRKAGDSLDLNPLRGRLRRSGFRVLAHVRPYLIFYRVLGGRVFVATVRHGARRPL